MRGLLGGNFWFGWTRGVYPKPEWVEFEPGKNGIDGCWLPVVGENGDGKFEWFIGVVWENAEFNDEVDETDELWARFLEVGVVGELTLWDEWFELDETLLLDRRSRWFTAFTTEWPLLVSAAK